MTPAAAIDEALASLWSDRQPDWLDPAVPRDLVSLREGYARLRASLESAPRKSDGEIEKGAQIQGDILSMGRNSRIEAGAIVHRSCRLVLGEGAVVRSGAILRDEVVLGPRCLVGAHCEVVRSLVLGPDTALGHFVYLADSIVGRNVNVAGYMGTSNTTVNPGRAVNLKYGDTRVPSGRDHLGALVGDGVRFGAFTNTCPGCIVMPGLTLPPGVVLYGTIDARKRDLLIGSFYEKWDLDRTRAP